MNFLAPIHEISHNNQCPDLDARNELHNLCNTLNTKAQKYKRQEILNSKRKDFTPFLHNNNFIIEDPNILISELSEIVNRSFNKSSISNTHKNKHLKKILGSLRKNLHDSNEAIQNIKKFEVYLETLIKILQNSPTDILFESLRNISLLTFHSDLFDSKILIVPLLDLVEIQEKKLNIINANIVLEKTLFSIGNLVLESNYHHEMFTKSKLPELLTKMLYRNDINLLTTGVWVLSNMFRNSKESSIQNIIKSGRLHKVLIHLFNKFNENSNPLLISELLWLLAIISNVSSNSELFNSTLILKISCFLTSQNIKISIPALSILANLASFLGENCFELIKNQTFQNLVEIILSSNIYIWKRELIFLLSNFVAVDQRVAEFFISNENFMKFFENLFHEVGSNNNKDDIFQELCYFFYNITSHKNPYFAKVLSNHQKIVDNFNGILASPVLDFGLKNMAKNFLVSLN